MPRAGGAVLRECGISDLGQCPERVGEHVPVEPVVRRCCQVQEAFAGVPAAGQDRVDVEEIPCQCPSLLTELSDVAAAQAV